MMLRFLRAAGGMAALFTVAAAAPAVAWDSTRLSVPLVIDGNTVPYREFAVYLMPGQSFRVSLAAGGGAGLTRFLDQRADARDAFTAPRTPGLERLHVENAASGEVAVINVFTLVPIDQVDSKGFLNGYRIGRYPAKPLRGMAIYRSPPGLVEVTAENADTRVSPNFRLGQFVSKQDQDYPKYLVLRPQLLLKLEQILAALNLSGRPSSGLVVMSGYRTPWYNAAIGNVPYSRHAWGGAADIYVDESPRDGVMDDLNGDGRISREDAVWLAKLVDDMAERGEFGARIGGLGIYDSTAAHGPFVHVDVRGYRARW